MKLSLLDYAPIDEGGSAVEALRDSVELAGTADRLGYHRFWLAEHHGINALATVSPEVLIANHAAVTERMRIGSGGVMIPNYTSMKVAENFRQLAALHPGRIDLGVGRASGSADARVTRALNDENSATLPFAQKMDNILGFLTGEHGGTDDSPADYADMRAGPVSDELPAPFILAAGGSTASYAGERGIGFTFAHFINGSKRGPRAAEAYREAFRPSRFLDRPHVVVAVFVVVGDTEQEADEFADAVHVWMARIASGARFDSVPSLDYAREHPITQREQAARERNESRLVHGTPDRVVEQLAALGREYGADEVMVNPMVPGAANRQRMITAIADAW